MQCFGFDLEWSKKFGEEFEDRQEVHEICSRCTSTFQGPDDLDDGFDVLGLIIFGDLLVVEYAKHH